MFNHKYGNNKKNIWSASSVQNIDPAADSGGLRTNDKTGSAFVPKGTPSNNSSSAKVIQGFENPNTNRQNSDGNTLFRDDPLATILGDSYVKASEAKAMVDGMTSSATEAAKKLGLDNVVVLPDGSRFTGRKARAKGWYDFKTGKIYIIAGNHTSEADILATLMHEAVAHYGLRQLMGEQFDTFLDDVYNNADPYIQYQIDTLAEQKYNGDRRTATEEYMAAMAQLGD